jgi:serine/threonine-protein kinase
MAAVPVAVGEIIAGKYRVERVIGSGGMGMVVAAWHTQLDQLVAVKLLHSETAGSGDATERFRREARAAARIRSEHVARVIDIGIWTGGIPYIVMEYLEGNDVAAELAARGPLPAEECLDWMMQAIEALAEAHAAGIVHRDLKPGNLFLAVRADGTRLIKVLDFGISKQAAAAGEAALTRTSSLIGSPLYMSPEQMRSARTVDARADIWSIGAIMFELLTGRAPFGGETVIEACTAILNDELPSLLALRPDLPPFVESVVRRCLEKNRDNRYPSVGELAADLAGLAPASRVHAERAMRVLGSGSHRLSGAIPVSAPIGALTPSGSNPAVATPPSSALAVSPNGTPSPVAGPSASWETASTSKSRRWPIVVMVAAALAVIAAVGYREFAPRSEANVAPPDVPKAAATPTEPPPSVTPSEPVKTADPVAPSASGAPLVSALPSAALPSPVVAKARPSMNVARPAGAATPVGGRPKERPGSEGVSDFGGRR